MKTTPPERSVRRRRTRLAPAAGLTALLIALGLPAMAADVTAPAEVTGLQAALGGPDIDLSWETVTTDAAGGPEAVDHYNIYRGAAPHFVPDKSAFSNRIGTSAGPSFSDSGAAADGNTYYYRVSAVDASGNESATKAPMVTTPPVLSSGWTETTIELSWTHAQPQGNVAGYRVYTGRSPGRYEFVDDVGLATSHSLTGLQTNVFWWSAVTAVDLDGNESSFSNERSEAVAGRGRIRAHDQDYLCWGASKCPPDPGEVQRADGWQLLVPVDFPDGPWTKVTVTYTMDSRLCTPPAQGTTSKCGDTNPGGYNPCGDPWDRIAHLFLVVDDCVQTGAGCINPANPELMRAITPFGTDAPPPDGTGVVPPRVLTLDITPYAPLLAGRRHVGAEIGHYVQAGWWVTVDFDLNKRTDEASAKKPAAGLKPLIFDGGGSVTTPRSVTIPADAQQVFARFFGSGHGGGSACEYIGSEHDPHDGNNGKPCSTNADCPGGGSCQTCDEFCHREHHIKVNGQDAWVVVPWRSDCSPGSVFACQQWNACGWPSCTFSRAGWCPGYIACHKNPPCDQDIDLTNRFTPGAAHDVTWLIDFNAGSWSKSMTVYWYTESIAVCGNGVREGTELCDGSDLGGETCQSQGFDAGTLACNGTCDGFVTSGCRFFQCGNNICERAAGENCLNCAQDCNGVQGGNPGSRYCCGNGGGQNPVPCTDPRCTSGGKGCE